MKHLLKATPYIIIAGLLGFLFISRWSDYDRRETRTVETDSTTTITDDSTTVDWSWLPAITPPETIRVEVPVPAPIDSQETDSVTTRTYKQSYTDSLISAEWITRVAGSMLAQEFSYTPHIQRVRLKEVIRWRTAHHSVTRTVTVTKEGRGYMTVGGMVGVFPDIIIAGPTAGWTSPRGDHFEVGYDPFNEGVLVKMSIRFSPRRLLGF